MTTYLAESKEELVSNLAESRSLGDGRYKDSEGYSYKITSTSEAKEIWGKTRPYLASLLLVSKINGDIKPFPDYDPDLWNSVELELLDTIFGACDYELFEEVKSMWHRGVL